jgi:hypothetical protein
MHPPCKLKVKTSDQHTTFGSSKGNQEVQKATFRMFAVQTWASADRFRPPGRENLTAAARVVTTHRQCQDGQYLTMLDDVDEDGLFLRESNSRLLKSVLANSTLICSSAYTTTSKHEAATRPVCTSLELIRDSEFHTQQIE